ncbi:MAG: DUF309 domain-containing protein [Hyphomicrobiales bacterium]
MPSHPPRYTDLPLPEWRCVPVHAAVPDSARLEPVTAGVPDRLDAADAAVHSAFLFGIDLYNHGFFWEAHELWEPCWMALAPNSRERTGCRALIQGANACLKLRFGWRKAFFRLSGEVARLVRDAHAGQGDVLGIDLETWSQDFSVFAERLRAGGELDPGYDASEVEAFPYLHLRVTRR